MSADRPTEGPGSPYDAIGRAAERAERREGPGFCYRCRRYCDPDRSSCAECYAALYAPPEPPDEPLW